MAIYGLTEGFGLFKDVSVSLAQLSKFLNNEGPPSSSSRDIKNQQCRVRGTYGHT